MRADPACYDLCLHMGDNCLILGQRLSQWCGHAPVLEEDIAQANIALDLIGQAQLWLELAGELEQESGLEKDGRGGNDSVGVGGGKERNEGKIRSADDLAYLRDAGEFRNVLLVELPNGDYAKTLMRQALFDCWHVHMLRALSQSPLPRIAQIAAKALKEATYHLERSAELVIGLGDGSEESHRRMQRALDDLWMYSGELFESGAEQAAGDHVLPDRKQIKTLWQAQIDEILSRARLTIPQTSFMQTGGRRGVHTEHLGYILAEMQFLQRAYPGCQW